MIQMAKIKLVDNIYKGVKYHPDQYFYQCEGCGYTHCFALLNEGGHHAWNGDFIKPTVWPSLLENKTEGKICHSFIKDGSIQYLNDCTHHLRGKTIDLPEIK
jgi:hypothetical protein